MAYVDAELDEADRKDDERLLADDQEARGTVERYRKTTAAIDQFTGILDEPVPDHLIETVRQHERQTNVVPHPEQTNTGRLWMAIAASLVVGVGLGAVTTNYLVVKPSEDEASNAVSKVAELSGALKTMKADKEAAEKNVEVAERNATAAGKATAAAKSEVDSLARALITAQAEKKQAQEQVLAANTEKLSAATAEELEGIFPFSLVSEAIGNGSKLSAGAEKVILSELNKEDVPTTTASNFSKLIRKSTSEGLTTGTSQYETLSDVQPVGKPSEKTLNSVEGVLGEFSYSGKTCRLIEYKSQDQTEASTLVACRVGSGHWQIIKGK